METHVLRNNQNEIRQDEDIWPGRDRISTSNNVNSKSRYLPRGDQITTSSNNDFPLKWTEETCTERHLLSTWKASPKTFWTWHPSFVLQCEYGLSGTIGPGVSANYETLYCSTSIVTFEVLLSLISSFYLNLLFNIIYCFFYFFFMLLFQPLLFKPGPFHCFIWHI